MRRFISTRRIRAAAVTSVLVLLSWACSGPPEPSETSVVPMATPDGAVAEDVRIVVLGNSIAAGLGLPEDQAFPAVLEQQLIDAGHSVRVVNAGVSGDTSAGGLRRIEWLLQQNPDLVVVELGGNDALRGQPLEAIEGNLRGIVRKTRAAGARVLLLGMDVPTNYGPDYGEGFAAVYDRIAADEGVELVPGFMREVGVAPDLMQPDGLHPTAKGQQKLAEQVFPAVEALVVEIAGQGGTSTDEGNG